MSSGYRCLVIVMFGMMGRVYIFAVIEEVDAVESHTSR